jgi:tRNA 2-thiouridine synthesizing protein A
LADTSEIYDLRGLNCPMPVLKTRKRLGEMSAGERLTIETTDSLAVIDIPHFCQEYGHKLLSTQSLSGAHRFTIERGTSVNS